MRHKLKYRWWALQNWIRGLAFSPIHRCRVCGHTVYRDDRRGYTGCRYCP